MAYASHRPSSSPQISRLQREKKLSRHEIQQKQLQAKIEEMEKSSLDPKTLSMQGEVTAAKRPLNSALEADLDFEHNVRPPPVITEEYTASIEEIIKKRIVEGRFDDVQRAAKLPSKAPREFKELDEGKSKKGLAEIYEEEYLEKAGAAPPSLSFYDELKKEANMLFKRLTLKLNALSHFHFAPKPVVEDMSIETNLPALAMEEREMSEFRMFGTSPKKSENTKYYEILCVSKSAPEKKLWAGRTDNAAVKNRFTTLCKKRAKCEALAKEKSTIYTNANNKRPIAIQGSINGESPLKKMRIPHIPNLLGNCNIQDVSDKDCMIGKQHLRSPFAVIAQNGDKSGNMLPQHQPTTLEALIDGSRKFEGFLKKDDPKILALMQQAELLSSLAVKVNTENTEQSSENAWKVLDNFLTRSKDNEVLTCSISGVDLQLDQLQDLVDDLRSCDTENQLCQRQPDLYDSPSSSGYSTGSTILSNASEHNEQTQSEMCTLHESPRSLNIDGRGQNGIGTSEDEVLATETIDQEEILLPCAEAKDDGDVSALLLEEYSSPLQTTPLFSFFAATIPSPQFSESERHFLMKTLGIDSPAPNRSTNPSQPPPCRRALVHSL